MENELAQTLLNRCQFLTALSADIERFLGAGVVRLVLGLLVDGIILCFCEALIVHVDLDTSLGKLSILRVHKEDFLVSDREENLGCSLGQVTRDETRRQQRFLVHNQ